MINEVTIKIKDGEVVLRKPKAGVRNKAMIKAETPECFKKTIFYTELLPGCIKSHPWGIRKVSISLEALEIEDYDLLIDGLETLLTPPKKDGEDDVKKNLKSTSDQDESQPEKVNQPGK